MKWISSWIRIRDLLLIAKSKHQQSRYDFFKNEKDHFNIVFIFRKSIHISDFDCYKYLCNFTQFGFKPAIHVYNLFEIDTNISLQPFQFLWFFNELHYELQSKHANMAFVACRIRGSLLNIFRWIKLFVSIAI